ncbi:venom serine protease Bi-VSP-like isoform X1 [Drosophila albomicans]|uniref:Venom serine protease Bi-VSP-like isoform X1 n=1 Tax=Drosophila albomicans TaxID=7291 RepID=A0A9C6STQ8_DROAB|nr:venom serine protease Bi-VSP-like isoform X1 [Drosophila albomicans]
MMIRSFEVIVLSMSIISIAAPALGQFFGRLEDSQSRQQCLTPEHYLGTCVALIDCPQVSEVYNFRDDRVGTQYVLALHRSCGTRSVNGEPIVCCTRSTSKSQIDPTPTPDITNIILSLTSTTPRTHTRDLYYTDSQSRQQSFTHEYCRGTCVALSYCPQVTEVYNFGNDRAGTQYVLFLHRSCGSRSVNGDPIVCCTRPSTTTTTTILPISEATSTTTTTTTPQPTSTTRKPEQTSTTSISPPIDLRLNSCLLSPGVYGECIDIKRCPSILNQLKAKGNDPELVKFIKASNLLCDNVGQNVCCPTEPAPRRLPTEKEGCGEPNLVSFRKIVGGDEAMKGAYPWIALLGYGDSSLSIFKCGGTLITARHVVTAAHCIKDNLSFVRLGEHDLSTDTDTTHMDINIVKNVSHSNYNKTDGRSDIAMLYLERNVEFTNIMKPICLPNSPSLRAKSYVDTNPIVIGWGNTQEFGRSAKILRQLMIPVLENSVCQNSYKALNLSFSLNQFDKAILCAGTLAGGEDSCQGDSGGPLMTSEQLDNGEIRFYLIGIVAYGYGCARPNSPGIYTSTQYFMDWINDKVREMS